MNIALFEIEDWERKYLRKRLKDHRVAFFKEALSPPHLKEMKETEILSPFIYSSIGRRVIAALPRLKLIATRSTGFDHIDLKACRERNISVCNVPSYGENTVAEHAFALILSLSRHLYTACIKRLTHDFSIESLRGFDLRGKTLGVVGAGRIGLHVIRIGRGFGMTVLASSPDHNDVLADVLGFRYVSLEELLAESHIVSLHVPHNEETHHLLNRETFGRMRKGAILINTSRGAVVDTAALIEALDSGRLAGAGLDVLEGEEFIKEDRAILCDCVRTDVLTAIGQNDMLLRRQNVVYTPHIGFNSQEALERILDTTVDNIAAFAAGNRAGVSSETLMRSWPRARLS